MRLRAIALGAGLLGLVAGGSLMLALWASSSSRASLGLEERAAVALQASYNATQTAYGVNIRIVGDVSCHATRVWSPTSASVVCRIHAVGPRNSATGGCAQVVGVYYDRLAAFAESTVVNEPCPGT